MEYTINKLARLAGVSPRTLRYYEELGLLTPTRVSSNGYRIYSQKEVDQLQQILFYRELDVPLDDIRKILADHNFNRNATLESHLAALCARREQLDQLIATVKKSLRTARGETPMKDEEKFAGFKQKLIEDNEKQYGTEIREKYGEETVQQTYAKMKGLTQAQYGEVERLSQAFNEKLIAAMAQGDPAGELAQQACDLHRQWLGYFWTAYSPQAHAGLAQMYVEDPRFTAYYDKIAVGSAPFLRDAIQIYCAQRS